MSERDNQTGVPCRIRMSNVEEDPSSICNFDLDNLDK